MNNFLKCVLLTIAVILSACGGGGDSSTDKQGENPPPIVKPTIVISLVKELAVENNNTLAKFSLNRTGSTEAIAIEFTLNEEIQTTIAYAENSDYQLVYSDGEIVGSQLTLVENQNTRIIEVHAVEDSQHEVKETLNIALTSSADYQLGNETQVSVVIADADNSDENGKVFLGYFTAQEGVSTTASGVMSLILQGDNEQALITYTFSDLGSEQTDQHIHLAPSGTMIKDIEHLGSITNYVWDLSPGGPFTSKQQMLDTLFEGKFFLNIHTANHPSGEIFATFNYDASITPQPNTSLTEKDIDRDINRFLTQASFGATPDTYQAIKSQINQTGSNRLQVYEAWIDEQMNLSATSMLTLTDKTNALFPDEDGWHARRDAFWPIAIYGKDQLRQRVTFALSEILVIGDELNTVRKAYRGLADYWDTLASNAFGRYDTLLEDVSRHAVMGVWLSHLKNSKANPDDGIFPDENYAREIMQLFSFGLVHRQNNGAIKLNENNLPQQTYDNNVIKELARVFTGLSFSHKNNSSIMEDNNYFLLGSNTNDYQFRWTEPMRFFTYYHDFDSKTLFHDGNKQITIEATNASIENADNELKNVIANIVAHPSTAPFISRQLIQRLVTSNPSHDYILRVSSVFGETGDMAKTIKAILLDPEARNPSVVNSIITGKVKEPILRFSALMRLLDAQSSIALTALDLPEDQLQLYEEQSTLLRLGDLAIGQRNLGASSVFNFYLPDFSPTGQIAKQALVAPELQLMTESQLVTTMNISYTLLNNGYARSSSYNKSNFTKNQVLVSLSLDSLKTQWQSLTGDDETKSIAIIDYLDFYLNAGQLSESENKNTVTAVKTAMASTDNLEDKLTIALYGLFNSPEFLIQN